MDVEDFNEYINFQLAAKEVYEKSYIELLVRFHDANYTSQTKKEYKDEMKKAKSIIEKYIDDEEKRLKKSYDKEIVEAYCKKLRQSITRDSNYLKDSWRNLPINQGKEEAKSRASEVKENVKKNIEEDENFFTWFAFNKK